MKVRGVGRLKVIAGKIRNRISPGTVILLYHRVANLPSDPLLLSVSPEHFAQHLEVIRKVGLPVSLQNLQRSLSKRNVPERGVVITFDDGAADNLHNAKPLLEKYDAPATVFVASGYLDQTREFWWDELERLLLQPGQLPPNLLLNINGTRFTWELGSAANYPMTAFEQHRGWTVLEQEDPTDRHRLYRSLSDLLRPLPSSRRVRALDELHLWSGSQQKPRATHVALSPAELRKLGSGELIEIGAHTVTHPVLSALPREEQQREILNGRGELAEILGQPILSFAYPYGTRADYSADSVSIVRNAGFACACSNFTGTVQPGTDQFQLPRLVARDWDGDQFERRLKDWFRG